MELMFLVNFLSDFVFSVLFSHFHVTMCCGEAIISSQRLLSFFTPRHYTLLKRKKKIINSRNRTGKCEELRLKMTQTKI